MHDDGHLGSDHVADQQADGSMEGGFSRRQVLQAGAGAGVTLVTLSAPASKALAAPFRSAPRLEIRFDEDWRFFRGDPANAQLPSFDDGSWRTVDAPHDWRIEDLPYATSQDGGATAGASGFAYESTTSGDPAAPAVIGPFDANADPTPDRVAFNGIVPGGRYQAYTVGDVAWYRKHVRLDLDADQRVELAFDGIAGRSDVYINGNHLGFHPSSYSPFFYDLTPFLNLRGDNVVAVRVNNQGKTSRWYPGSGIYRHTQLTITGSVRVPRWSVAITTPVVNQLRSVAHAEVTVSNTGAAAKAVRVRLTALDPSGRVAASTTTSPQTVQPNATADFAGDLNLTNPQLWSPETPNLYQLRTDVLDGSAVLDTVLNPFGVRSLVWSVQDGLLINGESIKLLGGNVHHEHGALGAAAIDDAEERMIVLMKEAGFNAVRTAHNPRSDYMLEVCDRVGMLVWDEFTDVWEVGKTPDDYSNYFPQYWQADLTNMVMRDRNHPSIIIWSLGNEIRTNASNNYAPQMKAVVETFDTTRPVTVGGSGNLGNVDDVLDVHYGLGFSASVSSAPPSNGVVTAHNRTPGLPVTQSETLPATMYDDFALMQQNPWMVGNFVWTAWDYLGESGVGAVPLATNLNDAATLMFKYATGVIPYPWFNAGCGDLDIIGQRRPQNFLRAVVQGSSQVEMFVERPVPGGLQQFAVGWSFFDELQSWTWDVPASQMMTVHVYTAGDSVTLKLNGKTFATNSVAATDRCIATFSVPYTPGQLTAVASRNGKVIGQQTLRTVGPAAALRLTADVPELTTSRGDLAHVLVEVVDAFGSVVPDAVTKVTFNTRGAGQLVGVANGNPHNVDSFKQPHRYTWHGRALAILRPDKLSGVVSLSASAAGLRPDDVTLRVRNAHSSQNGPWSHTRRSALAAWLSDIGRQHGA